MERGFKLKFQEIGVDLGSRFIKIASVDKIIDVYSLSHGETYKHDYKMYSKDFQRFLKRCIKDFIKKNKIKLASLNISIPFNSEDSQIFQLSMPIADEKVLNKGVKYEVDERMILDEEEDSYHHLWEIVDEYDDLNEYEVMVATLKNDIINSLSTLKRIRWRIRSITLQPITFERMVEGNDVILDFGHKSTRIYMYKSGKLSNIETIDFAGSELLEIVSDFISEGEDFEDVFEQIFVNSEYIDKEGIDERIYKISLTVTSNVNHMIDEIKRVIRGFELTEGIYIDNIYYIGEISNILYFIEFISSELDNTLLPLELLTPGDGEDESYVNKYTPSGLVALEGVTYDMNFSEFAKWNIDYSSIAVLTLCVSLSLGIAFSSVSKKYDDIVSRLSSVESQQKEVINDLDGKIETYKDLQRDNLRVINAIEGMHKEKRWFSDILYKLPKFTPKTVVVSRLSSEGENVIIEGYAVDYSSIGFLAMKLEEIGDVDINSIDNINDSDEIYAQKIKDTDSMKKQNKMNKKFKIELGHESFISDRGDKGE